MDTRWSKRKRDDWDDEDNGDERTGAQVLPVARSLPADGIPRDGSEYLLMVRMAAEKLPAFTKVVNPYGLQDGSVPTKRLRNEKHPALPSDAWKNKFSTRLLELRKNMCQVELSESSVEAAKNLHLPGPKDRPGWQCFIFGTPTPSTPLQSEESLPAVEESEVPKFLDTQPTPELDVDDASSDGESGPSQGLDQSDSDHNSVDRRTESNAVPNPHPHPELLPEPSPALLRRLSQHTVAQLLLFYEHWIRESLAGNPLISISPKGPDGSVDPGVVVSRHHSNWLFGLIACYDNDVMTSKEVSALRSLARVCIATICRSHREEPLTPPAPDGLSADAASTVTRDRITGRTSLWMVVAAVASVWGQSDIWEEANEKLYSLEQPLDNT